MSDEEITYTNMSLRPSALSLEKNPTEPVSDREKGYLEGNRAAWIDILGRCALSLGVYNPDPHAQVAALLVERELARNALISLAERLKLDASWNRDLGLPDVIEKRLGRQLEELWARLERATEALLKTSLDSTQPDTETPESPEL